MNSQIHDSDVREFYQELGLPAERIDAILSSRELIKSARVWKRIAISSLVGLAAMTLTAIRLTLVERGIDQYMTDVDEVTGDASSGRLSRTEDASAPGRAAASPEQPLVDLTEDPKFMLVAFRSHNDGCPDCRATGEVFVELQNSLEDAGVQFEQFQLGSPEVRRQTEQRLAELQLMALVEGRSETAFLALTRRDGQKVREFKPSQGGKRIAAQVREFLNSQ